MNKSMNKNFVLRGLIVSVLVPGPVGIVVFRFFANWNGLVSDVGVSGAWGIVIVTHLIYSLVIGIATFIFLTLLEKMNYEGSVFGAGLSAAISVTIVNIISNRSSIDFGNFIVLALWVAWVTWVVNFVVYLLIKLLNRQPDVKRGSAD